jgi:Leucine-rich repeat (LRR) protein
MEKEFVLAWKAIAAAEDRQAALVEHFRYLADTPGFEPVLEAVMKAVVDVTVDDKGLDQLILHFPGTEKLCAAAPAPDPSESYPQSFRNVLSRHSFLELEDAWVQLGDHGMFDDWVDDLEAEGSELVEFGLDTILSPMSNYSDLWIYHPGVKNAYGEPALCYISHEGGDICDPEDWNIGSLFLSCAANVLKLDVALPAPAPSENAPEPADWWNGLSDAWKTLLRDQWEISEPDHAGKAFQKRSLNISNESQVGSLEPARVLRKLQSIACESQAIRDLSPLTALPELSSVRFTSKAITDFSPLAQCKALTSVTLTETSVADLTFASALTNLVTLECDDTAVSDLSPLEGLHKLEQLSFARTQVSDLTPLAALKTLSRLNIADTPVASLEPLSGLDKLSFLAVQGTKIETLRPIQGCKSIHILDCENTSLSFDEQLAFYASFYARGKKRKNSSLSLFGDSINIYRPEIFINTIETTPPATEGVEDAITILTSAFLRSSNSNNNKSMASRLLRAYFALSIDAASDTFREELAVNAMAAVAAGLCDEQTEKLIFERLIDKGVTDSCLAFNLACHAARRGDKGKLLEYMALSLKKGHDRERFRANADFAAYQDDSDFVTLLETPAFPDPETDPLGWWLAIPESLRESLDLEDQSEEAIREHLHGDRFDICYDDAGNLDPLRNLRGLKTLTLDGCRALSLDAVSTLTGLEYFWCDPDLDPYMPGTRFTDATPLAPLKKLEQLILTDHKIEDISPLAGLSELRELGLRGNPITSIKPLSALVKLQYLSFSCTGVIDTNDLARLTALNSLSLEHFPIKWTPLDRQKMRPNKDLERRSDAIGSENALEGTVLSLEGLRGMEELSTLRIQNLTPVDGKPFSLEPLAGLEKLGALSLAATPFVSLEPLYSLPSLKELYVKRKMISPELEAELKTNMPRCQLVFQD